MSKGAAEARPYAGPSCQVKATFNGSECGKAAYQTINGTLMCDDHAALERLKAEGVRGVQDMARSHCRALGLSSADQVRAYALKAMRNMKFAKPNKEWASRVMARAIDTDLPKHVVDLAKEVAGSDTHG